MKSRAFLCESVREIKEKIGEALQNGFSASLGIVFSSPRIDVQELSEALGAYEIKFLGCTTDGEILNQGDDKAAYEGMALVCLVEMDKDVFDLAMFKGQGKTSFEVGVEVGAWGKGVFSDPAFIVVSAGLHADGEQILRGLLSIAGEKSAVYGGLAGDDKMFKQTFVFTNGGNLDNGVTALVFDANKVEIGGIATSGWIGIGAEKRITKASGNVVYAIDNEPALQVYKRYMTVEDHELPQVGVDYPLMLLRDDGSSVLRGIMDVDKAEGSLTFAGTVPEGSRIRFSCSSGFEVIEHVKKELDLYHKDFPEADLLLLFSCMARHLSLGPMVDEEIVAAQRKWNVPLVGFFTYGEIGRNITGRCDFFNETFTLAALRMK